MTDDLLKAECAIGHLSNKKIIENREWKSQHYLDDDIAEYSVFFINPSHSGDVRIQIIKRGEYYFISRSIIKILAKRHHFDASNILLECATTVA